MVLVLNGPNLNLLGQREPELYGQTTLEELEALCEEWGAELGLGVVFRQSNYEGQLVEWIQQAKKEEYRRFYQALLEAQRHTPHAWEKLEFFEACLPIEELARRGYQTPLFGPLKPVGLKDPRTGKEPFAVVQLRPEDKEGRMWSLVGFQTGLKWPEQKRLVRLIPGLENAEIVRYGVMHRNTYLNAPRLLQKTLQLKDRPHLLVAGVLAGVEGYLESAATGFLAGLNAARLFRKKPPVVPPEESMLGGLVRFLATANPEGFQPMNANWGLVPPQAGRDKREKRERMYQKGLEAFQKFLEFIEFLTEAPKSP